MMLMALVFLALLFLASLLHTLFNFPNKKTMAWLQSFFTKTTTSQDLRKAEKSSNTTTTTTVAAAAAAAVVAHNKGELRSVFATFDKNNDGFITKQELKESLGNIGIDITENEVVDMVAEASISTAVKNQQQRHPKARRVCFSFAAYAKKVIQHLESCNVPIAEGLTDDEFSAVESQFNFTFPPDLRSILQEGLPVGPGFPNWRSSSSQQLEILTNLPILSLCKQVSIHNFWAHSWGDQPNDTNEAVQLAKRFLKNKSPILVPIYRHCYIPSSPNLAGNPVFYVHGADVRLASFDVAGFFHRVDFPVWAATEPRRIEFWTEMMERAPPPLWWTGDLVGCMEDVCWRLRNGGWKEDEVREMMMMDGGDERDRMVSRDLEGVVCHVRVLSLRLLRAGWSTEDVVDSLGYRVEYDVESWLDFQHTKSCLLEAI